MSMRRKVNGHALPVVSFKKGRARLPRLSQPYVPGRRHERFWRAAELAVVRTWYPRGGAAAVQAHWPRGITLRSRLAIYQRAGILGLGTPKDLRTWRVKKGTYKSRAPDAVIEREWALLDGKKRGAVKALADRLGVPRHWLTQQATRLGLTIPHRKEPPWTRAEIALMRKVPLHDVDKCATIFRAHGFARTPTAIMVKAKRLDISRRYRETLCARTASPIIGFDNKTVTTMCIAGEIKATRRKSRRLPQQGGTPWSITPKDLRRFVLANLERIDLRKVDKFAFVQLIAQEPLA